MSLALGLSAVAQAQKNDDEYTKRILDNTPDKRILTELVDHMPVSATVPSPLAFLKYVPGENNKLTYHKDIVAYYEALDKASTQWWGIPGYMDQSFMTNFWAPAPKHLWSKFQAAQLPHVGHACSSRMQSSSSDIAPALTLPIAVNTGQNSGPGFCWLYGSHVDFDQAKLAARYPTHAAYTAAVRAVTEHNVKAGYILRPDADATIAAAERSAIGKR